MIDKCEGTASSSTNDISRLKECVEDVKEVARQQRGQGCCARLVQFRKDGEDIQKLGKRIDEEIQTLTLAGVGNLRNQMEEALVRMHVCVYPRDRSLALEQGRQKFCDAGSCAANSRWFEWIHRDHENVLSGVNMYARKLSQAAFE